MQMAPWDRFFKTAEATPEEELRWSSSTGRGDRFITELAEAFSKDGTKKTKNQNTNQRIPKDQLFNISTLDDTTFRCVNFYAQQVIGPDFILVGKNEKAVELCERFKKEKNLNLKVEDVVRDMCIGGNGWLELMQDGKGKLADVAYIDFRFMDFKRDTSNNVMEKEDGNIEGYVYKNGLGENLPLEPDYIAHFPLFGRGNELAYGFVEPLYRTIFNKLNVVAGLSQGGWRIGYPLTIGTIGDKPDKASGYPGHKVTQEQIDQMGGVLEDIQHKHKIIIPYYAKIEQQKADKVEFQSLFYFDARIAGSFGIPGELVGLTTKTSKSALETISVKDLDRTIASIQSKVSIVLLGSVFKKLCLDNGFSEEDVPESIVFNNITPPDMNRAAKRREYYVNAGILSKEELRPIVIKEEGLDMSKKDEIPEVEQPSNQPNPEVDKIKGKIKDIDQKLAEIQKSDKKEVFMSEEDKLKHLEAMRQENVAIINEKINSLSENMLQNIENLQKNIEKNLNKAVSDAVSPKIENLSKKIDKIPNFKTEITALTEKITELENKSKKYLNKKDLEKMKEEILKEKEELGGIVRAITEESIAPEEAILLLRRLKSSFPSGMTSNLVDELIKQIMLKTTGIEVPTETGGMDVVQGD